VTAAQGPRRLRVAIVASWYPSIEDPIAGIFVRDQANVLAERHDVAVIAPRLTVVSRRPATWSSLVAGLRNAPSEPAGTDDVVLTARPRALSVYRAPRLSERSYERAIVRGLRDLLGRDRPDLIHAHVVLPAGLAAARIGRRLGIPVVLTEHSGPFAVHLESARASVEVGEALRAVDRVVAVSQGLRDEVATVAPVRIDVIGNVIAPEFFRSPPSPVRHSPTLRLLAVGFLKPPKRFDVLLDALAAARLGGLDVELVVVGDGPDRDSLQQRATRLGIGDRVRFVPMGTRSALLGWLEWCDALVSSSDHESFGLVIAEALATGRPVVATASGGPQTFVDGRLGTLVPTGDPHTLVAALANLPGFLAEFDPDVARARMSELFGPEAFIRRMTGMYEDVLATSGR